MPRGSTTVNGNSPRTARSAPTKNLPEKNEMNAREPHRVGKPAPAAKPAPVKKANKATPKRAQPARRAGTRAKRG